MSIFMRRQPQRLQPWRAWPELAEGISRAPKILSGYTQDASALKRLSMTPRLWVEQLWVEQAFRPAFCLSGL